ncbi:MAG: helix-turn-helix transcriptional regulator [Longimicrobiales bacterium]|nr:helix-turn-helix transcriptional regulator [Longimicrobiales bacterium]
MTSALDPSRLVRAARLRAGLSQRAMASRAGTSQSVVARIETGVTDPSFDTVRRLLAAAGLEALCALSPEVILDTHMLDDVERILALSPEERLREVGNVARFVAGARRV